jgi:two-component system CheB/CheR fusion protein
LRDVEWSTLAGEQRWLDVHIIPLADPFAAELLGASITFTDVSAAKRLQRDLEHTNQELETAYEELQSTNEELETTNEELQSTVEELETTNEELQSTNEELETMNEELQSTNEELQSTNEELQTINDELRQRGEELNEVNGLLESILTSMRGAVMVIDPDAQVLVWNQGAEDLWGLREEEVRGKNIFGLDIGLPTDHLRSAIRASLAGARQHSVEFVDAINRRGREIACLVTVMPLHNRSRTINGVILITEEVGKPDGKADGKVAVRTTGKEDGKRSNGARRTKRRSPKSK